MNNEFLELVRYLLKKRYEYAAFFAGAKITNKKNVLSIVTGSIFELNNIIYTFKDQIEDLDLTDKEREIFDKVIKNHTEHQEKIDEAFDQALLDIKELIKKE